MKPKNNSISFRIKTSLLILSFGLSVIFAMLTFLLLYVIEDQVFINQLHAEQKHYEQLDSSQLNYWQPSNRLMQHFKDENQLPDKLKETVKNKYGIFEYFEHDQAYFILHGHRDHISYFITFDVSELLAVKKGKYDVIVMIVGATLFVMLIAMFVSIQLSKKILAPLQKLTSQIQENGFHDLPKNFSEPFAGDEIGLLATQLEVAIKQAQSALQREFEFNSGVSHELRTPIQVALNSVELIELTQQDLKQNKPIKRLKRSIVQMEQISEAFLWLASSRSLDKASSHPQGVIESLKLNYQQQFQNQKLIIKGDSSLQYDVPHSVLSVILDNLLKNAFQHGQGNVQIKYSKDSIEIINQKLSHENSESKGYGVGLMIVIRICKRLGWQLEFDPSSENCFHSQIRFT